jgi:hypothetical protein
VKGDGPARSSLVKAEVESLSLKEREDIVKERIGVWKVYDTAYRDNLQMRNERAILLQQGVVSVRREGKLVSSRKRLQPDHGRHRTLASRHRRNNAKAEFHRRLHRRMILCRVEP